MRSQFLRLFDYNLWANQKFVKVLEQEVFVNSKILTLLSHIANAQKIWLDRVNGSTDQTPVWETHHLSEATDLLLRGSEDWLLMIKDRNDFGEMITYRNSKGVLYASSVSDIFTHVANHGTHHRGQIATLLRAEEITPPASDFIFFTRT